MRIAYITETFPPDINGVALTTQRAVRYLRDAGHHVVLLRPAERAGQRADTAELIECFSASIPWYPDLRFGYGGKHSLRRRWLARRIDLVHAATPGPLACNALRAARSVGIYTSSDYRTHFEMYSRYYGLGFAAPAVMAYLRYLNRLSDRTFVPTEALEHALQCRGFERLSVCGRGVDASLFTPQRRDPALRAAWGAREFDPVALYVGRLAAEKNVGLALAATRRLRQARPNLRVVVIGDGPLMSRLRAEYPEARFTGVLRGEALACHYASADMFLFPSTTDTFGNVVLEALSSGLVVTAYRTGAAEQFILHGRNGWLASLDDAADFHAAARSALNHCSMSSPLRQAARASATRADWAVVLAQFEQALIEVTGRRSPSVPRPTTPSLTADVLASPR